MSITSRLFEWIAERATREMLTNNKYNQAIFQYLGKGSAIWQGVTPENYIKKGYNYNADVYSIINIITSAAKNINWKLYKVDSRQQKYFKSYKSAIATAHESKDYFHANILRQKAMEEIADHEILNLLYQPNETQGWSDLVETILGYKLVTGNSYLYSQYPDYGINKGIAKRLYVLPAQWMEIEYSGDWNNPIGGYKIIGTENVKFVPAEILHLKYWQPDQTFGRVVYGLSPLQAANRTLTSNNEADETRTSMFQNKGAYGIVSGGSGKPDERLSNDEMQILADHWKKNVVGAKNANKLAFFPMPVSYQSMGLSAVDMNILESKKYDMRSLCNIYGIQSQLLNDPENKTYNNQLEAKKSLYTDCVIPLMNDLRDNLNRWDSLIPAYSLRDGVEYYLEPDYAAVSVMQSDMDRMTMWIDRMVGGGTITRNEARLLMSMDRSEQAGADDLTTGIAQLYKVGDYPVQQINPNNDIIEIQPEK